MARRNATGVETGDTLQFSTVTGTVAANSTRQRSGRYCLRANPATTATGYVRYGDVDADGAVVSFGVATGWIGIHFQCLTLPAANDEPIFNCRYAGGNKCEIRIDSAGKLQVYDSALTGLGLGTTALELGRYYFLTFYVTTSSSASAYELKINNSAELSGTGAFTNNNVATYEIGKTINRNGNSVDFYYDDIVFDDAAEPSPGVVVWAGVSGAGSTFNFSNGTYADVDETPPNDGDTTYIDSATNGHVALCTLTLPSIRGTVSGFKGIIVAKEATTTASSLAVRIRMRATDYTNTGRNLTTSYTASQKFYALNPNNGAALTIDDVRDVEVGAVMTGASGGVAIRVTLVGAEVEFLPAPTPGASMIVRDW